MQTKIDWGAALAGFGLIAAGRYLVEPGGSLDVLGVALTVQAAFQGFGAILVALALPNIGRLVEAVLARFGVIKRSGSSVPPAALVLLYLLPALVPTACGSGLGGVTWPDVARCGPSVPDLVATVSRVLLSDRGVPQNPDQISTSARNELEGLARDHGPDTVACLVDLLIRRWTSPGASQSPETVAASARGRSFLVDVGTAVESNPAFEPVPE